MNLVGLAHRLVIGEKIKAQYGGRIESLTGQWFNGWVATLHDDGTCDVHYTDGDKEEGVPRRWVASFGPAANPPRGTAYH